MPADVLCKGSGSSHGHTQTHCGAAAIALRLLRELLAIGQFFLNPFVLLGHSKGMTAATAERRVELADLVREHQAGVWQYLRFLGCHEAEADDLTQDVFLSVIRDPFEVRSPAETAAYLRTAARNRLLMTRRKQGREPSRAGLEAAEAVWAEVAGADGLADYLDALAECLGSAVTDRVRRAIDLRYRDGLGREEMAERLEMTADGVKTLLRRARGTLRECVERKVRR